MNTEKGPTFEEMYAEMEQGRRPEKVMANRQFTDQEVRTIEALTQETDRFVPDSERMLTRTGVEETELAGVEPFPLSVLSTIDTDLISGTTGSFYKLNIDISVLRQAKTMDDDLKKRLDHVTERPTIEFDMWMLRQVDDQTRLRVLKTVHEWEKQMSLNVRFEGVIGLQS